MSSSALESQGMALYIDRGDVSPTSWTQIPEVKNINFRTGSAAVIDVTDLSSTAKEKRMGLADEGQCTFTLNYRPANGAHAELAQAKADDSLVIVRFGLPAPAKDNPAAYYESICAPYDEQGGRGKHDDEIRRALVIASYIATESPDGDDLGFALGDVARSLRAAHCRAVGGFGKLRGQLAQDRARLVRAQCHLRAPDLDRPEESGGDRHRDRGQTARPPRAGDRKSVV